MNTGFRNARALPGPTKRVPINSLNSAALIRKYGFRVLPSLTFNNSSRELTLTAIEQLYRRSRRTIKDRVVD